MHSFEIKSNTILLVLVVVSINECEIKRASRIDEQTTRGVKESISVYTHTFSLANTFDSVTHVLTVSKLPRGKIEKIFVSKNFCFNVEKSKNFCFNVAVLVRRADRGGSALFRKGDISRSGVDIWICLHQSE